MSLLSVDLKPTNKRVKPRTCEICGKDFLAFRSNIGRFCGRQCHAQGKRLTTEHTVVNPDGSIALALYGRGGIIRAFVTVDAEDAEWATKWRWNLHDDGYAVRSTPRPDHRIIKLHREILGLVQGDGMEGDHIDRVKLNCRRNNLRAVPYIGRPNQQNMSPNRNSTSPYRGVSWNTNRQRWIVQVHVNGKVHQLGYFTDEMQAAEVARAGRLRLMPYAVD